MRKGWTGLAVALWLSVGATAQQAWTVKPEWVRAHEAFLASDAMRGRGSATHDEEVTATYVASEFEAYGLKTAPGMAGYIQSAEVVKPVMDGMATLQAGGLALREKTDFDLIASTGVGLHGPLVRLSYKDAAKAKLREGSIVFLQGSPSVETARRVANALGREGFAVLLPGLGGLGSLFSSLGSTRTPAHLEGENVHGASIVILHESVLSDFRKIPDGQPVTIEVHTVAAVAPRLTYNAIGYLAGSDPSSGTVLLTAHLDHLGVRDPGGLGGDDIFNGADDDASGTTAVLELAHALAAGPKLKRSVLFVCYGSEELGGLGSTYFGAHPPVPLKSLVANLEFEMIGIQDPGMPKGVLLLTGWDRSNLGPTLKAHGALLGPDPYPEEHYFQRSDNYSLALLGVVAQTAAGWGSGPTYHHPDDDLAHIDIPLMTAAIQSLVEPMRWLADSDFVPQWNAGGKPERQ